MDAIKTNRLQAKQKVQSAIEPAEDGGRTGTEKGRDVVEIKPRIRMLWTNCTTTITIYSTPVCTIYDNWSHRALAPWPQPE